MKEEILSEIEDVGREVEVEVDAREDTLVITNFIVKKSERNEGKASNVMNSIIEICEKSSEIRKIRMHIGLTYRDSGGYPEDKSVSQDPTIKFLEKMGFSILDYGPTKTVLAERKV